MKLEPIYNTTNIEKELAAEKSLKRKKKLEKRLVWMKWVNRVFENPIKIENC